MRNPIEAIHERNDLDVICSQQRETIRTLEAELENAESRYKQLRRQLGLPEQDDTDLPLKPDC